MSAYQEAQDAAKGAASQPDAAPPVDATPPKETNVITEAIDTPQPPLKTAVFVEAIDLTEAVIDEQNRTVRQRIIVAGKSKNNRLYSESVLEKATPLFEGVQTYANHQNKTDRSPRNIRDLTGWITQVEYREGALYGTRHFTRTEAGKDAWTLVEDIISGRAPKTLIGGSINAAGKGHVQDGVLIVDSIEKVDSVDDVHMPAAGGGFERLAAGIEDDLTSTLLGLLEYQEWFEARPEFINRLKGELKTVRLDEVTKAKLAEADQMVKAANSELETAQTALQEAQTHHATLQEANGKLLADLEQVRVKLAVLEALEDVQLPTVYKTDLRESLPKLPTEEWAAKIKSEIQKAKSAGVSKPRVPVTDAGFQEAVQVTDITPLKTGYDAIKPLPGEDYNAWLERTTRR